MDNKIKVSILDDEATYKEALKKLLSKESRIMIHGEYKYATEFIDNLNSPFKADVYLLDIKLTGEISGIDCAKKVRERDPYAQIIFLTGCPEANTLAEAKNLHAFYIEKGSIGETLIDKIITCNKRREQLISLQDKDTININHSVSFIEKLEKSQNSLSELSEIQKKVIKLRQQGKTINEIAHFLDIKPNTVCSHLERAMKKLSLPDPLQYLNISE